MSSTFHFGYVESVPLGGLAVDGSSKFVGVHHILLNSSCHPRPTPCRLNPCPLVELLSMEALNSLACISCCRWRLSVRRCAPHPVKFQFCHQYSISTSYFLLFPSTGLAPNRLCRLPVQIPRSDRRPPDLPFLGIPQYTISS